MSNGHPESRRSRERGVEYKRIRSDKVLTRFENFSKRKNMIWSDPFGDKRQKKSQVGPYILGPACPGAAGVHWTNGVADDFFGIFLAQKFEHK